VAGLLAGTTYNFKVAAINRIGNSTLSSVLPILAANKPDPPTELVNDWVNTSNT
jgi:hypothetical protein